MTQHMNVMVEAKALEDSHTSGFYRKRDAVMVRGKGARLWDSDGREYIDCATGHGVALLGHAHPAIGDVLTRQAGTLITCPEIFYNDVRSAFLHRLSNELPPGFERLFLCNSGTESVEAALKVARLCTGRHEVVAAKRAFHGRSMGSLSATWEPQYRQPFEPLVPGFRHVPYDDSDALARSVSKNTAAVILEIIQGEGGVRPGSARYFQDVRYLCERTGAMLIIDEVQTGFGRTGRMFACEHFGLVPDMICLGKGIAGGLPMGAVGFGHKVMRLPPRAHGSTFGGNPLCCAAALETIDIIQSEQLTVNARLLGEKLITGLRCINSALVREVRGLGLMVGIELKTRVTPLLITLMTRGVVALPAGSTVLRLLPPLVISETQLDDVVTAIDSSLAELSGRLEDSRDNRSD